MCVWDYYVRFRSVEEECGEREGIVSEKHNMKWLRGDESCEEV